MFLTVIGWVDAKQGTEEGGLYYLIGLVLSPITTFLLVIAFMGVSNRLFQSNNSIITYFVDASYWIYLLHLVVVFVVGSVVITAVEPIMGVSINIILTTLICICTYHVLVRYTPIGWTLHGNKGGLINLIKKGSENE